MVFKLNENGHKWVRMTSLEDKILILGADCSYLISVKDFVWGNCNRNCIFLDEVDDLVC